MKPIENNKQTFTKLNDSLRRISVQKINSTQKIFFAYILGWQEKEKTLTAKNKYIADQLGLTESGLRKVISTSNKFDFFSSKQLGNKKGENGYTSTHEIKIDVDKFEKYLKSNNSKASIYEDLLQTENLSFEIKEPIQPAQEIQIDKELTEGIAIDTSVQIETNPKKEKLREKYNSFFKYNTKLTPARFHDLTDDYFMGKLTLTEILAFTKNLNADGFDFFWDDLQKLKGAFLQQRQ